METKKRKLTEEELEKKLSDIRKQKETEVSPIDQQRAIKLLEIDIDDRERMLGRKFGLFLDEIADHVADLRLAIEMLAGCKNADEYLDNEEKKVLSELAKLNTSKLN